MEVVPLLALLFFVAFQQLNNRRASCNPMSLVLLYPSAIEFRVNKYRGGTSDATTSSSLTVSLIMMLFDDFQTSKIASLIMMLFDRF